MRAIPRILLAAAMLAWPAGLHAQGIDWQRIDDAIAKPGNTQGDVRRYELQRSDLNVTIDGVTLKPNLALAGWVAFKPVQEGAWVTGDLLLTETEVGPVMSKLLDAGFEVGTLHNRLLRGSPATFFVSISARGNAITLADAIHAALIWSNTRLSTAVATTTGSAVGPAPVTLDTAQLDQILGAQGRSNEGVYQFALATEPIMKNGMPLPPEMGAVHTINFQPALAGKAAVAGALLVTAEDTVNPVLRILRDNDIEVTSIHNYTLKEQPRTIAVHFWANNDAVRVAKSLRAALDKIGVAKN
jgi:Domain of Unknown Function (DUF1259)